MDPWRLDDRRGIQVVLLVLCVSGSAYLATLAPGITPEDSGELVTAAAVLGVPHPPGYPLWTILAHLATYLPVGGIAFRVNLFSAFGGAMTAAVVSWVAIEIGVGRLAAAAGGLLVAFSRTFWHQSVIAEVYTLNTFFLSLALLGLVRFRRRACGWGFATAIGSMGLALGNHYMLMMLVAPPLLVHLAASIRRHGARVYRRVLFAGVACGLLGIASYLYLPWAAARHPPLAWGAPEDWPRFWAHVTRRAYNDLEFGIPVTTGTRLLFLGDMVVALGEQWTPYLLPLAGIGMMLPWAAKGPGHWKMSDLDADRLMFCGIVFFNGPVLLAILHFAFSEESRFRIKAYYLPAWISAALFMSLGLDRLMRGRPLWQRAVLAGASVVLPFSCNLTYNDLHDYRLAEEYNRRILESLEPGAVYFTGADYNTFPCLYLQAIEGLRPDVLLADIEGLRPTPAVQAYLATLGPDSGPFDIRRAQELLITDGRRPLYVTARNDIRVPDARMVPWGWVYRVETERSPAPPLRPAFSARDLKNRGPVPKDDHMNRGILGDAYMLDAENAFAHGDSDSARALYETAAFYYSGFSGEFNNLGVVAAQKGFYDLSERFFRKAVQIDPLNRAARMHLARWLLLTGRRPEAMKFLEEILFSAPGNPVLRRRIEDFLAPFADTAPPPPRRIEGDARRGRAAARDGRRDR